MQPPSMSGIESSLADRRTTTDLIDAVRELIDMMGEGGITELDLTSGDVSIRLRGRGTNGPLMEPEVATTTVVTSDTAPSVSEHVITAPMIGTYYSAPAPGDAPFVQVGDEIEVGQTIGIIEAMKIMNEIAADRSGTVKEILVSNAQAVEFGSPLIRLTEETDSAE